MKKLEESEGKEPLEEKIRKRTDRVKSIAGNQAVKVLGGDSIVDKALKPIITEQVKGEEGEKQKKAAVSIEGLPLADCMTSELIVLHRQFKDNKYQEELQRRFDLLGLTDEQRELFEKSEMERIKDRPFPALYPTGLTRHYFLMQGVGIEDIPTPEQCLSSELFAIFDDAHAASVRDHHWLPERTMNAVKEVLGGNKESPYFVEYDRRVEEWGWTALQISSFNKNEMLILWRVKWRNYGTKTWRKETMVTQEELDEEKKKAEEARRFWKEVEELEKNEEYIKKAEEAKRLGQEMLECRRKGDEEGYNQKLKEYSRLHEEMDKIRKSIRDSIK